MLSLNEKFVAEYFAWIVRMVNTRERFHIYGKRKGNPHCALHRNLTDDVLLRAARAEISLALKTTGPDNVCKWAAIAPDGDNDDRIFSIYDASKARGCNPILFRNGPGSYHLYNLFAAPQPLSRLIPFNDELRGDWFIDRMPLGEVDIYPGASAIRMPGLDPKRGTHSQAWDGEKFVEFGTDAWLQVLRDNPPVENPQLPPPIELKARPSQSIAVRAQLSGPPAPTWGAGTNLKKTFDTLKIQAGGCGGCAALLADMNRWGAEECRKRKDEIMRRLNKNKKTAGINWWTMAVAAKIAWTEGMLEGAMTPAQALSNFVDAAIAAAAEEERRRAEGG